MKKTNSGRSQYKPLWTLTVKGKKVAVVSEQVGTRGPTFAWRSVEKIGYSKTVVDPQTGKTKEVKDACFRRRSGIADLEETISQALAFAEHVLKMKFELEDVGRLTYEPKPRTNGFVSQPLNRARAIAKMFLETEENAYGGPALKRVKRRLPDMLAEVRNGAALVS